MGTDPITFSPALGHVPDLEMSRREKPELEMSRRERADSVQSEPQRTESVQSEPQRKDSVAQSHAGDVTQGRGDVLAPFVPGLGVEVAAVREWWEEALAWEVGQLLRKTVLKWRYQALSAYAQPMLSLCAR
eukprot:1297361-Rhodomonas_salina.2